MELVQLLLPSEESKKSSGLASDALANKTVEVSFMKPWSKNGKSRTNNGEGFVGVWASIGFMNASQLLEAWDKQNKQPQGLFTERYTQVEKLVNGRKQQIDELVGYDLVCDPAIVYKITGDDKGKVTTIDL
jgi:hypothetical protein